MAVALERHNAGVLLPVRAQPGSRSNALRGEHQGALKVCVTQVAEQGKATAAIVDVLCRALKLRRAQVTLVSGATARNKTFLVQEIELEELARRIAAQLEAG